jgi:hypothetical protein
VNCYDIASDEHALFIELLTSPIIAFSAAKARAGKYSPAYGTRVLRQRESPKRRPDQGRSSSYPMKIGLFFWPDLLPRRKIKDIMSTENLSKKFPSPKVIAPTTEVLVMKNHQDQIKNNRDC